MVAYRNVNNKNLQDDAIHFDVQNYSQERRKNTISHHTLLDIVYNDL